MSTPAATAAAKLLSGVCSQASRGASMPAARSARRLGDVRDTQPGGSGLKGGPGHRYRAVPVRVGLHHGHDLGRRGALPQDAARCGGWHPGRSRRTVPGTVRHRTCRAAEVSCCCGISHSIDSNAGARGRIIRRAAEAGRAAGPAAASAGRAWRAGLGVREVCDRGGRPPLGRRRHVADDVGEEAEAPHPLAPLAFRPGVGALPPVGDVAPAGRRAASRRLPGPPARRTGSRTAACPPAANPPGCPPRTPRRSSPRPPWDRRRSPAATAPIPPRRFRSPRPWHPARRVSPRPPARGPPAAYSAAHGLSLPVKAMASRWLGRKAWKYCRFSSRTVRPFPAGIPAHVAEQLRPRRWCAASGPRLNLVRRVPRCRASAGGGLPDQFGAVTGAGWPWVTRDRSWSTLSDTVTGECQPGTRRDRLTDPRAPARQGSSSCSPRSRRHRTRPRARPQAQPGGGDGLVRHARRGSCPSLRSRFRCRARARAAGR